MREKIIGILIVGLFIVADGIPLISGNQTFDEKSENLKEMDWWPMFHHDLSHSGYSTSTGPETNNVLWDYHTLYIASSSPAVADGKVYIGSWSKNVFCIDADTGKRIWYYTTGDLVLSSPAVSDGRVYIGCYDQNVYCLDETTGIKIWNFTTGDKVVSSPAVSDGKVYIGSWEGKMYCLDAGNGALIWNYKTNNSMDSSPAVANGKLYFGSHDQNVYCLDADTGAKIWNYTTGHVVYLTSPAISESKVYIGSEDKNVYCLDADTGAKIWNYTTDGVIFSSPAVADGKVYIGSTDKNVYCLDADTGAKIWNYTTDGSVRSSPAVADGKIYIGSDDYKVYCLDADTGAKIWNYTTDGFVTSSPAVADGKVYIGSDDYKLYCFGTSDDNTGWIEMQKLLASDGTANDYFGWSVSIDGDTALIGAYYDDDNGQNSGSAYVFIRTGTTWTQQAKLLASDGATDDWFGYSVSLDGDTALIGARCDDGWKGSAYIFTRTGTNWNQQAKLVADDGVVSDQFGFTVSLDCDTAIIGAISDCDNGNFSGSAYVFIRTGTTWTQQAKILPLDGIRDDHFGLSVSIDGDTAIISSNDDDKGKDSGSAYVFTRTGTTWTQQAKLLASDGATDDWFGVSVSLDGNTAIIGSVRDDDNGPTSGSAYIFTRTGTTWTQQAKLLASDGAEGDGFGCSVSIDGESVLIAAIQDDDNGVASGSVYFFKCTGAIWAQEAKIISSDGEAGDFFGYQVSLDGDNALISAIHNDGIEQDSGSAYVFIKQSENQPPNAPIIVGQLNGNYGNSYEYSFFATDPDGDDISYCIDWDDESGELCIGPFPSDLEALAKHTWSEQGEYTIKAKARDIHGAESEWATLSVSMPKIKIYNPMIKLVFRMLERFPLLNKILSQIIKWAC